MTGGDKIGENTKCKDILDKTGSHNFNVGNSAVL